MLIIYMGYIKEFGMTLFYTNYFERALTSKSDLQYNDSNKMIISNKE